MKWHKIPSTWRHSETAQILKSRFGREGPYLFLELIQTITSEIQSDQDIDFLYEKGWKKPRLEWAHCLGIRPSKLSSVLTELELNSKISTVEEGIFLYIKIHQVQEFIDERAISSMRRHKTGTQRGPTWVPTGTLEKRREVPPKPPGDFLKKLVKTVPERRPRLSEKEIREQQRKILEKEGLKNIAPIDSTPPQEGSIEGEVREKEKKRSVLPEPEGYFDSDGY